MNPFKSFSILFFTLLIVISPFNATAQRLQKPRIYLESSTISPDTLEISVKADSLTSNVFGIAFDLVYDNELVRYKSYKEGNFFERGGKPIYLISPIKTDQARLVSGISLKNGDIGVNGGGKLATLYFTILKKEPVLFRFENTGAVIVDKIIQNYSNIEWDDKKISLPTESSFINNSFTYTSIALISLFVILMMIEMWILYASFKLIKIQVKS